MTDDHLIISNEPYRMTGIATLLNSRSAIIFHSGDKEVIRINFDKKTIEVEGDWDEAAKIFIELLRKHLGAV